jgi:hypothetical protein
MLRRQAVPFSSCRPHKKLPPRLSYKNKYLMLLHSTPRMQSRLPSAPENFPPFFSVSGNFSVPARFRIPECNQLPFLICECDLIPKLAQSPTINPLRAVIKTPFNIFGFANTKKHESLGRAVVWVLNLHESDI